MNNNNNNNDYINKREYKPIPLLDGIEEIRQDFEERIAQGDTTYGIEIFDDCVETIRNGSVTFIIAAPNVGKAVTLDTKILTPNGWVLNKDIKVGDYVIGRNGNPTKVLGVFPQGITETFKVIFADGREVITSPEHLWTVESSHFSCPRVLNTVQLMELNKRDYFKNRLHTPIYSGNHGKDKSFLIPPYVLGVLIGDGCLTMDGLVYCKPSMEVFNKVKSYLPDRDIVMLRNKNVSIRNSRDLKLEIERYGLNVKSYEKFIPEDYLEGTSKEQRLDLLQGLLDTDGFQTKSYNEFSTTSKQLAEDIQQLAWSLGFDCRIKSRMGKYKKNGVTVETRPNYRVIISNKRTKAQSIIKDVVPYKRMETQCIAVDAPDKLFVIENYIVTHNSLWGLTIATNLAKQEKRVLICSCEMGAGLLMERQLRNLTGISMKELRELYTNKRDSANYIMDSVIEQEQYNYLHQIDICETGGATVEDLIRMFDCFPEFEYIIVDYIQRIRGTGTEYENITNAARELQTYARRTGKKFIICSQASRQSNDNAKYSGAADGNRIRGKGSGSIEEDADVGLTLMELEEGGSRKILATLFKNRYGNRKNITYKYRLDARLCLVLEDRNYTAGERKNNNS